MDKWGKMAISKVNHSNRTREQMGQNKEETEIKLVFDRRHLILHSTTNTHDNKVFFEGFHFKLKITK